MVNGKSEFTIIFEGLWLSEKQRLAKGTQGYHLNTEKMTKRETQLKKTLRG